MFDAVAFAQQKREPPDLSGFQHDFELMRGARIETSAELFG